MRPFHLRRSDFNEPLHDEVVWNRRILDWKRVPGCIGSVHRSRRREQQGGEELRKIFIGA